MGRLENSDCRLRLGNASCYGYGHSDGRMPRHFNNEPSGYVEDSENHRPLGSKAGMSIPCVYSLTQEYLFSILNGLF